jgi:hypothetical protein
MMMVVVMMMMPISCTPRPMFCRRQVFPMVRLWRIFIVILSIIRLVGPPIINLVIYQILFLILVIIVFIVIVVFFIVVFTEIHATGRAVHLRTARTGPSWCQFIGLDDLTHTIELDASGEWTGTELIGVRRMWWLMTMMRMLLLLMSYCQPIPLPLCEPFQLILVRSIKPLDLLLDRRSFPPADGTGTRVPRLLLDLFQDDFLVDP